MGKLGENGERWVMDLSKGYGAIVSGNWKLDIRNVISKRNFALSVVSLPMKRILAVSFPVDFLHYQKSVCLLREFLQCIFQYKFALSAVCLPMNRLYPLPMMTRATCL